MKLSLLLKACTMFLLMAVALPCLSARADDSTAYVVASDETFAGITGLRTYLQNGGVKIVQVKDKSDLAQADRLLVLCSPAEAGLAGDITRAVFNEAEMQTANTMGKGVLVEKQVEGKQALFFVTAYSMKTFVSSNSETWKDYFENWFNIAQSITSIIGY